MNPERDFDLKDVAMFLDRGTVYQDLVPNTSAFDASPMPILSVLDAVRLDLGGSSETGEETAMTLVGDLTHDVRDDTESYFHFNWDVTPIQSQELRTPPDVKVEVTITEPESVLAEGEQDKKKNIRGVNAKAKKTVVSVPCKEKGKRETRSSRPSKCSAIIQSTVDFIVSSGKRAGSGKAGQTQRKKRRVQDEGTGITGAKADGKMELDPKILQTRRPMKKALFRNATPEEKKDKSYYEFRRKNTESARRCREKQKMVEEQRVEALRAAYDKIAQQEAVITKLQRKLAALTQILMGEEIL